MRNFDSGSRTDRGARIGSGSGQAQDSAPKPTRAKERCKTYILVRQDIPVEQQLVQACHAALGAGLDFEADEHPHLALIGVRGLDELEGHSARLKQAAIAHHLFHEPDGGMGYSALATEPLPAPAWKHFKRLQLWRWPPAG